MSTTIIDTETGELRSAIACHICRKRKIKCGRELPQCMKCAMSSQGCEYPERIHKPGPKMGSSQSPRKRKSVASTEESMVQSKRSRSHLSREDIQSPQASRQLPTPQASLSASSPENNPKVMQSLSFIVHPSHEVCSPEERSEAGVMSRFASIDDTLLNSSCYALGIDPNSLGRLIELYLENFTSFQLFRVSHFQTKLHNIATGTEMKALLAAMISFVLKAAPNADDFLWANNSVITIDQRTGPHFNTLAMKFVDEAINECGDEPLTLPLLQALILTAHWLLIKGVRGRAWRYLGICVRGGYELNLHLVDSGKGPEDIVQDPIQWNEDEERRRAWWAIWEMDVFASVIRRCPTAIDWSQNETFLPAEDDHWFRGEPQASCVLEIDLIERWKALKASGNQSPKAWFIVINSLMKDAQKISSPTGVDKASNLIPSRGSGSPHDIADKRRKVEARNSKEDVNRLSTIRNCLHCAVMALPQGLKYQYQYLSFGSKDVDHETITSRRLLHSSIYSVHIMTQLTKLMTYKFYIFRAGMKWPMLSIDKPNIEGRLGDPRQSHRHALDQYFEAADEINAIVRRTNTDHYRYVNPFLANSLWLGATVQLIRRELASSSSDRDLVSSNFEVLCLTYNQFVNYWNMSKSLQRNLEIIERELQNIRNSSQNQSNSAGHDSEAGQTPAADNTSKVHGPVEDGSETYFRGPGIPKSAKEREQSPLRPHSTAAASLQIHPIATGPTNSGIPTEPPYLSFPTQETNNHPRTAPQRQEGPQQVTGNFGNQGEMLGSGTSSRIVFEPAAEQTMDNPNQLNHLPPTPYFSVPQAHNTLSSDLMDAFSFPAGFGMDGNAEFLSSLDEMLSLSYMP